MYLESLKLVNYKNYGEAEVKLISSVNCITGRNGSGKTNLLDAVYYLSFTKSYFNSSDLQNIRHGEGYMSIEGLYDRSGMEEQVRIFVQRGEKKQLRVNNNEPGKFSEHIGRYPLVIITPNDIMLIHEDSSERRKFLDGMISQMDKVYLSGLLSYNRTLEQRNRQLKQFAETGTYDGLLLETYNEQLARLGNDIYERRRSFLESFIPVFRQYYQDIASSAEEVNIGYESDLNSGDLLTWLQRNEQQDLAAGRTLKGIHKDELEFTIAGYPLKKYGSQGQQKSFIISLKLAQYAYLKERTGAKPLLLLDDIFEKLDGIRLQKLLSMIAAEAFGQIFISDTHPERLRATFEPIGVPVKYFMTENGIINEI